MKMDGWMDRLSKCEEVLRTNSAAAFQYKSEERDWRNATTLRLEWQMLGLETCLRNIDKRLGFDFNQMTRKDLTFRY